ncbi:type II toxin-antitoxin system RelE/ParE family toxin [Aquabacterium humicola]|uniref:type II toxin-antitoxin system RelE/ParE family toxin n=1 Tax=Aquabacterium humicola TaxID=3237377 RepID=UPI002543AD51|nr:type II toxin-antitoxin system RelE/ParE family toxin [Rubrivivax pictus]
MQVRYLPPARDEYLAQVDLYESAAPGLGERFIHAIELAEQLIARRPEAFRQVERDIRACSVRGFPFRLLYAVRDESVLVIAVAHTAREPRQFLKRG